VVSGGEASPRAAPRVPLLESGGRILAPSDVIAVTLVFVKYLLVFVAVIFVVSGLDDFFIDAVYLLRSAYRRLFVIPRFAPLTEDHLLLPAEKPVAILIPAWDESTVIRPMLDNAIRTINYSRHHFFVGTYPNDPATAREVDALSRLHDNVHRVTGSNDGPTTKADCLNSIYHGIRLYEELHGERFEILVLHDAEDVVHPLSLKLFNYLIPRKDMVQLPVFTLEAKWFQLTAGHYLDEFSEYHLKDLLVRETLGGVVPGAGVGCAYSRSAFEIVARDNHDHVFSTNSLTEDYDLSFRMRGYGLKQVFVQKAVHRTVIRKTFWTGRARALVKKEYIATRAFFPSTYRDAVRQKSRWISGIAFQGWANLGWRGGGWTKYMLFRDRKVILTNPVNVLAYVVVATVVALWVSDRYFPDAYRYPPLVESGSWLWRLILVDTFFLFWRLVQRVVNVYRIYGAAHAALSVPRVVWANLVNFGAGLRASYLFSRYLLRGNLAWEKTRHAFPSDAELAAFHSRLGELLIERRFLTVRDLEAALERQRTDRRPLGAILVAMGLVGEDDLLQALGTQHRLSTAAIDPYQTPLAALEALPRPLAVTLSVYPLELREDGVLVVATETVLTAEQHDELRSVVGRKVELCLSTRSDLSFAIRRGYERLQEDAVAQMLLGRQLLDHGLLTTDQLEGALRSQRRSYRRLGDVILSSGMMERDVLDRALREYAVADGGLLGEYLVQEHYITLDQLQRALAIQKSDVPRLGEVLIESAILTRDALERVFAEGVA
jgi:bacteriophage N4 adsorption protein B